VRLRNLAAAIFALEQSDDLAGQQRVIRNLRAWLRDRPDLRTAIGTWYAEALAPSGLLVARRPATVSLDQVEPMLATRILRDIERQVAAGEARGVARGEARGEILGRAAGTITTIRDLAQQGIISVDAARTQIRALIKAGKLPAGLGREALKRLG
jgi:hypothetical protein